MASSALTAYLLKIAITVGTDKRVRTFIASVIVGLAILLLIPLLVMVSLWNTEAGYGREIAKIVFDGGPIPADTDTELAKYMEDMIAAFGEIDRIIEENEEEKLDGVDDIKVKSFFYCLYFSEDLSDFDDGFCTGFLECFDETESDEEIYKAVSEFLDYEFTEEEKEKIRSLYLFIKYGYSTTDKVKGIPGEAFDDETFANLMAEATKYIGFPYVWGGSTPKTSFDCSGFVCWVYTQSGTYDLPRTTAQGIYNQCTPVSKDELKPGDLVFFTNTYKSSNPVTHIGIYVGENQMLHCGEPIGYASLSNSYWVKHFYGYGRL